MKRYIISLIKGKFRDEESMDSLKEAEEKIRQLIRSGKYTEYELYDNKRNKVIDVDF